MSTYFTFEIKQSMFPADTFVRKELLEIDWTLVIMIQLAKTIGNVPEPLGYALYERYSIQVNPKSEEVQLKIGDALISVEHTLKPSVKKYSVEEVMAAEYNFFKYTVVADLGEIFPVDIFPL